MSTWACPHGCDLSTKACDHLEALLPAPIDHTTRESDGAPFTILFRQRGFIGMDQIGELEAPDTEYTPDSEEWVRFYSELEPFGLNKVERSVLTYRFVGRMQLDAIGDEYGHTGDWARKVIKRALETIKRRRTK